MQADSPNSLKAFLLAFMAVNFRDAVSVFTRIFDMNMELLSIHCKNYFSAVAVFVSVTASVCGHWYTRKLFEKYSAGLGLKTRRRREAKHQRLRVYYKNKKYLSGCGNKITLEMIIINLDINIYLFGVPKTIFVTVVLP